MKSEKIGGSEEFQETGKFQEDQRSFKAREKLTGQ